MRANKALKESNNKEVEIDFPGDTVRAVWEYCHSDSTEVLRRAKKRANDDDFETTFEDTHISVYDGRDHHGEFDAQIDAGDDQEQEANEHDDAADDVFPRRTLP